MFLIFPRMTDKDPFEMEDEEYEAEIEEESLRGSESDGKTFFRLFFDHLIQFRFTFQ